MRRGGLHLVAVMIGAVVGMAGAGRSALAAGSAGSYEVGAYGHEIFPDVSTGIQNSLGYGVRAGYFLKETTEIELTWDKSKGDAILSTGPSFDIKKLGLMYVRNFIPKGKKSVIPTFVFGVGDATIDNGTASESDYYFRLGGGARVTVSPHIAVRLEVGILRWRGQGDVLSQEADYSFDAHLGVSFLFGGKGSSGGGEGGDAKRPKDTGKPKTGKEPDKGDKGAPKDDKGAIP